WFSSQEIKDRKRRNQSCNDANYDGRSTRRGARFFLLSVIWWGGRGLTFLVRDRHAHARLPFLMTGAATHYIWLLSAVKARCGLEENYRRNASHARDLRSRMISVMICGRAPVNARRGHLLFQDIFDGPPDWRR